MLPLNTRRTDFGPTVRNFSSLLFPVPVHKFIDTYWEQTTLTIHRERPDFYADVMTLADVDVLLESAMNTDNRILEIVGPPNSDRVTKRLAPQEISRDSVYRSYLQGDTIRLIGAERFSNPLALLVADMQDVLNSRVGVNLFLTPPQSQGFGLHFDLPDVFVIQLHGRKRWRLWNPTYSFPMESPVFQRQLKMETNIEELTPHEDIVLETGDFFYMPRGFYHEVTTLDEPSLHLTLTVHPTYWAEFINRACQLVAIEDEDFRGALPPGSFREPEVRKRMAQHFAMLLDRLRDGASFDATLDSLEQEWVRTRRFPADGHFSVLAALDDLTVDSLIERRRGLTCRLEQSQQHVTIYFGPNQVRGPMALAPIFEAIAEGGRYRISELPGILKPESKLVIAKRLVREGLIRLVS